MNRVQNISIISLCQGPAWNCDLVSTMVFFSVFYWLVICFVSIIIIRTFQLASYLQHYFQKPKTKLLIYLYKE